MAVYFIQNETTGAIKIGTSVDPMGRLRSLQTANADPLKLVATIPGGADQERTLHQHFSDYRIQGEWFQGVIMDHIESIVMRQHRQDRPAQVYCAGKIARKDWRHSIFDKLEHRVVGSSRINESLIVDGFKYGGPFFQGEGHGSSHGESTHGVFGTPIRLSTHEVENIQTFCMGWINMADAIFCFIDGNHAYGTAFELGYAFAKQKPIFLAIEQDNRTTFDGSPYSPKPPYDHYAWDLQWRDYWFIRGLAQCSIAVPDVFTAWELFVAWWNGRDPRPVLNRPALTNGNSTK